MEKSCWFTWWISINQNSKLPNKPLNFMAGGTNFKSVTHHNNRRRSMWNPDLRFASQPFCMQRNCEFKGLLAHALQHHCQTPHNYGYLLVQIYDLWLFPLKGSEFLEFKLALRADRSPYTLGILWVPRFTQQFWQQILRLKCYTCYWETCLRKIRFLCDLLLNSRKDKGWLLLQWITYREFNS